MPLPRFRWPLVLLLASIGLTAVAVIEAQRTGRSEAVVADRALRDYANFAAWAYAQRLTDTIGMVQREVLGAVNHGDNMHTSENVPRARDLAHYLPWSDSCQCHRPRVGPVPEAFFAMKIGQNTIDAGLNTHLDPREGWEVDRPMAMAMPIPADLQFSAGDRKWLTDSLTRRVRRLGVVDHGFTFVIGRVDDEPRIVAYTLMPTSWGDTMVYGAKYSPKSLVGLLEGVLDGTGLLPGTFTEGRRNRDILAVRVRDQKGNTLFESAPGLDASFDGAHVELPSRIGHLSVDAAIRPELAGNLIIGGLPRSRLPFLIGLLGLAAALSIVAVTQLKRDGELAQLRSGFVSSVSHQLRTPVAQIRLYLDTLRLGRAPTEEQKQWSLDHIERETTRLSHLVENVLRFSALGRDDPTHREPMNVASEVATIVEEFRPLAASKKAKMEVIATDAPPVPLRPDSLRHIVLNLLDNAVKYGPVGQTIRVRVAPAAASGVEVAVEDEGPGVTEEERDRIWRPFTRGERGTETGGSGIGLSVVREVVESHGGRAWVEATPSGGARFVVHLPHEATPARPS